MFNFKKKGEITEGQFNKLAKRTDKARQVRNAALAVSSGASIGIIYGCHKNDVDITTKALKVSAVSASVASIAEAVELNAYRRMRKYMSYSGNGVDAEDILTFVSSTFSTSTDDLEEEEE